MPIPIDRSRRQEISVLLNSSQKMLGRADFTVVKIREVMQIMTAEALLEAERSFDALPLRVRRNIREEAEGMAVKAARQGNARPRPQLDAGPAVMRPPAPAIDFIQSVERRADNTLVAANSRSAAPRS